jgi:serine racemase
MTQSTTPYCISLNDVQMAGQRIHGIAHRTPVLTSKSLIGSSDNNKNNSADDGKKFFFKIEAMQKTGSFKFRGALNAIKAEMETFDGTSSSMPVVTHSSGNHAQALALASKLASTETVQIKATIVMPNNAPMVKKTAVQDFGADIVMVENTNEAREEMADRIVETTGALFVHPSENPQVIAGQGTVCLEFVEQVREMTSGEDLHVVIIPVGGGGLASGNLVCLRGLLGEKVKIVLAEPSELDDAQRSFRAGTLLKHNPDNQLNSIADGLKTTLGPNAWPIIRDLADDIITVSEEEILRATKLVWERLKVVIEPSAGVGVAVARSAEFKQKYTKTSGVENVGIILCGGNVDILNISAMMSIRGL